MKTYTELMSGSAETLPTHLAVLRAASIKMQAKAPTRAEKRLMDFLKAHPEPFWVSDNAGRYGSKVRDVFAGNAEIRTTEAVLDRLATRGIIEGFVSNNGRPHKGDPSGSFIYFE